MSFARGRRAYEVVLWMHPGKCRSHTQSPLVLSFGALGRECQNLFELHFECSRDAVLDIGGFRIQSSKFDRTISQKETKCCFILQKKGQSLAIASGSATLETRSVDITRQ